MPSHKVVHEKSQENQQIAQAVQSHVQGKLIPEPGWMPLTDTPIGMYVPRERFLYKSQKKFTIWCPTSLSNEVLRPNLNFGAKNRHSSSDNVLFIQILSLACWS